LYFFPTPWWRGTWVVGYMVWFVVFVGLVATNRDYALGFAALSAVPLCTMFFDLAWRQRALPNQ